jgi:hypothetical protein
MIYVLAKSDFINAFLSRPMELSSFPPAEEGEGTTVCGYGICRAGQSSRSLTVTGAVASSVLRDYEWERVDDVWIW